MSKKLFLGLLLCVGLQGLNAADQGDQPAQPESAQPDQALALVDQEQDQPGQAAAQPDDNQLALVNQERQIVAFDPNTANAHQIAVAAGALAVRAGTELAQQSIPLARRGIRFSLGQIFDAGKDLSRLATRRGFIPTALASVAGLCVVRVVSDLTGIILPIPFAVAAGVVAGARATSAAANNIPRLVPLEFHIIIAANINSNSIFESGDIHFDRNVLKTTIQRYLAQNPTELLTMTYRINAPLISINDREVRTFSLETFDSVFNELIEKIDAAQK